MLQAGNIVLQDVVMKYPIVKRYREYLIHPLRQRQVAVLDRINLDISAGDCIGVLGVNGSGKTTLLKLVGGLLYPSAGRIAVNGYDTNKDNHQVRRMVGFVLNEERSFYWRLTGAQNLEFFGALDNLHGKALGIRIAELVRLVGLTDAANRRVSGYSSGMRQRLAIARGLLADPDVLLLDEPTKSIDPVGAEALREIISTNIHLERKRTLLIASHSLSEVQSLCNKACILARGRIVGLASMCEITSIHGGLDRYYRSATSGSGYETC